MLGSARDERIASGTVAITSSYSLHFYLTPINSNIDLSQLVIEGASMTVTAMTY